MNAVYASITSQQWRQSQDGAPSAAQAGAFEEGPTPRASTPEADRQRASETGPMVILPTLARLTRNTQGLELGFSRVRYRVTLRSGRVLKILKKVTGVCRAGQLSAIMGPSGAGKSTLLKVLARNISGGQVTGTLRVNGRSMEARALRRLSTVVWQRDILMPTATVREALMTGALLRLSPRMRAWEKAERVEQILTELGLLHVADQRIGEDIDGAVSGISGGERRRLSVGMGLVTDPRAIFLDEPTSGLDSDSAAALMGVLKGLARRNRTVVCTIHQPSSDLCSQFDALLLLSWGLLLYCGAWHQAEPHFAALHYPKPHHKSLAEHLLGLCKDAGAVQEAADCYRQQAHALNAGGRKSDTRIDVVCTNGSPDTKLWATLPHSQLEEQRHVERHGEWHLPFPLGAPAPHHTLPQEEVATSRCYQVGVLMGRALRAWFRTPLNMGIQVAQYVFFGALLGATYWRLPLDAGRGAFDRTFSLWFAAACMVLQPAPNACAIFYAERDLLRRELSTGMYHFSSFFVAKTLTSLPFQLLFALIFNAIVYFMVGYQLAWQKALPFLGLQYLLMLCAETAGLLCAALHRSPVVGLILTSALCLLLMMFTGFIQVATPVYFVWIKKASFVAFAYSGLVQNEFQGLAFRGPRGAPIPGGELIPPNMANGFSVWWDLYILCMILGGFRLLTFAWIQCIIRLHWL